jgi:hypothetical protein
LLGVGGNADSGYTEPYPNSANVEIKNNIFYSTTKDIYIELSDLAAESLVCDYNIYWCEAGDHEPMFVIGSASYTWTEWRAHGFDTHSVIMNPNFIDTVDFVPASRLNYGTNLGSEWEDGLSIDASWVVGVSPEIVKQNGIWQVGARVYQ